MPLQKTIVRNSKSQLVQRNSELHEERLNKLKSQVINPKYNCQIPTFKSFLLVTGSEQPKQEVQNTNHLKYYEATCLSPFQKIKVNSMKNTPNKSNYFQRVNEQNIQRQNRILLKKIERIVKGKRKDFPQNQMKKKSISKVENYDQQTFAHLRLTSDLSMQMLKHKATRSSLKQQQIRAQNQKILHRLVNQKPTISTRKLLSETKKTQNLSKRISKFSNFISKQFQTDTDTEENFKFKNKRYSLDVNQHNRNQLFQKETMSSKNKQKSVCFPKISTPQSIQIKDQLKRQNTQPIYIREQRMLSSGNRTNKDTINTFKTQDCDQGFSSTHTQNRNYFPSANHFRHYQNLSKIVQSKRRVNSLSKINEHNEMGRKKLQIKSQRSLLQNLKSPQSIKYSHKNIILAEIEKKFQNLRLEFKFVRFQSHYEIQINEKKEQQTKAETASKNERWMSRQQQRQKQRQKIQTISPHYSSFKAHSPDNRTKQMSFKKTYFQGRQQQRSKKKMKVKESKIFLYQEVGSNLFSLFDYDYHKIVEECLQFYTVDKRNISVQLKNEYLKYQDKEFNYKEIKQKHQDEEEDSVDYG